MLPRSRTVKALLLCAALVFASLLSAEPIKKLQPTGYVDDFARVIDPASREAIEQLASQIDQKTGAQIAVVTIRSLDGADIESYASDLYKQWGIGPKSSNRGVLILLAVNDRRYRTEVGYGLEPILPDGKVGGFGREAVPFLRQSDYDGAVSLMVTRVADVIAQDAGVHLSNAPRVATPPVPTDSSDVSSVIIVLLFVLVGGGLVVYYGLRKAFNGTGWRGGGGTWGSGGGFWGGGSSGGFFDNNSSSSGWGGFGGGDSGGGGGFGGFGGGDSGGG